MRFGGLSGMGWLLDFCILFLLVRFAQLPVLPANVISSITAATIVFLLSRRLVFHGSADYVFARVLLYCVYTLVVILLASVAMKYLAAATASLGLHFHHLLSVSICAMVAKIVVTPVSFFANFVVARFMSEHGASRS